MISNRFPFMSGFKRQRLTRELIPRIMVCFEPVQDAIGNVPIAIQSDVRVLAAVYAVIYSYLEIQGLDAEHDRRVVTDRIFDEIFRREATKVLKYCDQLLSEKNSNFCRVFETNYSNRDALDELASYIDQNYERQEYRDL